MLYNIIEFLSTALPLYYASKDAGIDIVNADMALFSYNLKPSKEK